MEWQTGRMECAGEKLSDISEARREESGHTPWWQFPVVLSEERPDLASGVAHPCPVRIGISCIAIRCKLRRVRSRRERRKGGTLGIIVYVMMGPKRDPRGKRGVLWVDETALGETVTVLGVF